jgi:hypothetical protein
MIPSPLLERSIIAFAIGLSSVPKYFMIIISDNDMTVERSQEIAATPLPFTP